MRIEVLDHGYVEFVEAWGHGDECKYDSEGPLCGNEFDYEAGIIEAARQSTQGSFRGWGEDQRLLSFLHTNKHATPFEFSGMIIEVQAPIFVLREWHRHRTQSYNEMSARYAPLPDLNYNPTVDRCLAGGTHKTSNKQEQSITGRPLDARDAAKWLEDLENLYRQVQAHYQLGLDIGLPKELARCSMTVARYSRMRAGANLRNWLSFLTLRIDVNAQWEIRQYANAVEDIIKIKFPKTWELFAQSLRKL